jgi:hypothetical protein
MLNKFNISLHNVSELYFSNLGKQNKILIFTLSSRILYLKQHYLNFYYLLYSFLDFDFQLMFI